MNQVEKRDPVVETHWLYSIQKNPRTALSKEGHADSVLGYEKIDHY